MKHDPSRTAALEKLSAFVPHAGRDYATKRNYDLPGHPHVSGLSPYIRHRILTEEEVLQSVLGRHSLKAAEKFVQEVYWRTYWKGWLEMRPSVWKSYQAGLTRCRDRLATEGGLRADWEAACTGRTGIDVFDHWAKELTETGYLHNHARMWFASIWIFTLRLPWELGADFFLRQLLDGDPASNTLSWRWVGGLQTPGKTYLARAANISKYTEGRFRPEYQLAPDAPPLDGPPNPKAAPLALPELPDPSLKTSLLLTEDDLSPGFLRLKDDMPVAVLDTTAHRSPLAVSESVRQFVTTAIADAISRLPVDGAAQSIPPDQAATALLGWAHSQNIQQIVTPYTPVGPAADALNAARAELDSAGIRLVRVRRDYDSAAWPHATHGFFRFKDSIPRLIGGLRGLKAA